METPALELAPVEYINEFGLAVCLHGEALITCPRHCARARLEPDIGRDEQKHAVHRHFSIAALRSMLGKIRSSGTR